MTWMRRLLFSASLYTFFKYQSTSQPEITTGKCICHDKNGGIYNLSRLQSFEVGKASFENIRGNNRWYYSYNPCHSFSMGRPDCVNDVAICGYNHGGGTFVKLGDQSTARCDTDDSGRPQLVYSTTNYDEPQWYARVTLICNRSKTLKADFEQSRDKHDTTWTFHLTHICACANGCLMNQSPTMWNPSRDDTWEDTWKPVLISAGGVAFVAAVVFIIWCLLRRQPNNNQHNDIDQERQRLVGDVDGGIDILRNNFPDETRSGNLRNASPLLPTSSASSCSEITVPIKDDFNNVKANVSV